MSDSLQGSQMKAYLFVIEVDYQSILSFCGQIHSKEKIQIPNRQINKANSSTTY